MQRQLGHADAAITLRVYAHWLPDASRREVDRLDDLPACSDGTPAAPAASDTLVDADALALASGFDLGGLELVTLNFTSWNQIHEWLRRVDSVRLAG